MTQTIRRFGVAYMGAIIGACIGWCVGYAVKK